MFHPEDLFIPRDFATALHRPRCCTTHIVSTNITTSFYHLIYKLCMYYYNQTIVINLLAPFLLLLDVTNWKHAKLAWVIVPEIQSS